MPDVHLTFGGSTAARTIACPGWLAQSRDLPERPESAAAREGTALHKAIEWCFTAEQENTDPLVLVGELIDGVEITLEHVQDKLRPALDAFDELAAHYNIDLFDLEQFVQHAEDAGGTMDFIAASEDQKTVIIGDWKFGEGIMVSPTENPQCLAYASWAEDSDDYFDFFEEAEKLVIAIIQPNSRGEPALKTWEMPVNKLPGFRAILDNAIKKARAAEPDDTDLLHVGEHCKFCPAEAVCPAKRGQLDLVRVADPVHTQDLGALLDACKVAEDTIAAIRKFALEQMSEGVKVDGWKLVQKRATRQWADPDAVEELVRRNRKIKHEETHKIELLSPAQMEKVYKSKRLTFTKLEPHITAVSSGVTLAPDTDKRPAALPPGAVQRLVERID